MERIVLILRRWTVSLLLRVFISRCIFILELLANGWTIDDILREYPHLTKEDVLAAIAYAAKIQGR